VIGSSSQSKRQPSAVDGIDAASRPGARTCPGLPLPLAHAPCPLGRRTGFSRSGRLPLAHLLLPGAQPRSNVRDADGLGELRPVPACRGHEPSGAPPLLRLEDDGDGPVVDQRHGHPGAEDACLNRHALGAQRVAEAVDERRRFLRRCGMGEARSWAIRPFRAAPFLARFPVNPSAVNTSMTSPGG
jgi:hypothetical protein